MLWFRLYLHVQLERYLCFTESKGPYSCALNRADAQREVCARWEREKERERWRGREREVCAHAGKERKRERDGEGERERCARAGKERPHARATVIFRCIIFIFATSRIHKKRVQLGHADSCRSNDTKPLICPPTNWNVLRLKPNLDNPHTTLWTTLIKVIFTVF